MVSPQGKAWLTTVMQNVTTVLLFIRQDGSDSSHRQKENKLKLQQGEFPVPYSQCKSSLSALGFWFNSVDKQTPPDLGNLFCFDREVAGKFRLISNKWQTKLNETQRSDLWLAFKGEDDKVIERVWASFRHKLFVSPHPLMAVNPSVRWDFFLGRWPSEYHFSLGKD